ncbi:MAG: hypothetical protein ACRDJN_06520 [Chloroflexota bacterium]
MVIAALLLGLGFALFNQLGVPLRATHGARVNGDEPFYLLTTVSLLADGDLDLANDYALHRYRAFFDHPDDLWHQSSPTADGRVLSPHNAGTSLLVLPAYKLGGVDGAKRYLGALAGLIVTFAALLAYRATGHASASLVAAALLGASAPLFVYATQVYPEAPAALLVTMCVWLLLRRGGGWRSAVVIALLLNGLAWLGVKYAVVGGTLALLGRARLSSTGRRLLLLLLVPSAAGFAWFHLAVYGGLTPYAVNTLYAGSDTFQLVALHLELWNRVYRLAGLWIDGEFGLVRWAPCLLLVLPALLPIARRAGPVRWLVLVPVAAQVLVAAFLSITMRGWWFPGRMLIVVLPLLVVPLAETLSQVPRPTSHAPHRLLLTSNVQRRTSNVRFDLAMLWGRFWPTAACLLLGLYTAGITRALREAVAAEHVVLAVNPFALSWWPFAAAGSVFPVYTSYEPRTWLLTAAWCVVGMALLLRGRPPAALRLLAGWHPHMVSRGVGRAGARLLEQRP